MPATKIRLAQMAGAAEHRTGQVTVEITDTSAEAVFDSDMGGSDYRVVLQPNGFGAALAVGSKTASGFEITFTAGITGTIEYIATRTT
jgi:hypothetical protein